MAKKNDPTPEEQEAQSQEEEKAEAEAKNRAEKPAAPPVTQAENALMHLHDLALRHRVPTWQQAALVRLMGWEEGKQVTDEDYQAALGKLSGRRMGGQ